MVIFGSTTIPRELHMKNPPNIWFVYWLQVLGRIERSQGEYIKEELASQACGLMAEGILIDRYIGEPSWREEKQIDR